MTANIQNGGLVLQVEDRLLLMDNKEFSGTKLLGNALDVKDMIANFVDRRLVDRKSEFAWQNRTSPGSN